MRTTPAANFLQLILDKAPDFLMAKRKTRMQSKKTKQNKKKKEINKKLAKWEKEKR